ncbi:hypothetical protein [Chryseobacterium sp. 8AT]|uniref:hypothetical protein n=1 Tax=Chryseobacterium sp. 8AT TaxID=2653134 RepID=UPI0012F11A5B|nr:hypothetical protein [Chryseobacterium sp. 8AT]VXB17260.1 conserved hypothetical protein [Chryseobacterium sp. 8AT]
MKAKILLPILFSGLILCCRSKHKITTAYQANKKETEQGKVDSVSVKNMQSAQNTSVDALLKEKKNETSGEILITGKSDPSNPFVFHNIVGKDTIQSISIIGNAEYSINNHYTKVDNKKSEVKKEKFTNIIQDLAHNTVSKERIKEADSAVFEETKTIKANGPQAGTWIVITIVIFFLIFIFFIYKYFKK